MNVAPAVWNQQQFEQDLGYEKELISLVLNQFLLDAEQLGHTLQVQLESKQNPESCRQHAHALKGAAAQTRCEELALICATIESEAQSKTATITLEPLTFTQSLNAAVAKIRIYLSVNAS